MSTTTKPRRGRAVWVVGGVLLGVVLACGLGVGWVVGLFGVFEPDQSPPKAAMTVQLPADPRLLAWSPDGTKVACGVWGGLPPHVDGAEHQGAVYVVDATTGKVVHQATLDDYVQTLTWSPDGRHLAVGTSTSVLNLSPTGPAKLAVFDADTFTVKLSATATANASSFGFVDLAWSPDGRHLYALEGSDVGGVLGGRLRRWERAGWEEKPLKQNATPFTAVAVSPDGTRVAGIARAGSGPRFVHLLDADGTETGKFATELYTQGRVGFSADGKLVGVSDGLRPPEWCDPAAMKKVPPKAPRWAAKPAAVNGVGSVDFDPTFTREARGERRNRPLGMLFGGDKNLGSFLYLTQLPTGTGTRWRLHGDSGSNSVPVPAFSPDGARLAVSVGGGELRVWDVSK